MRKIRISLLTFILFMMSFYVDAQTIRVLRPMGLDNENASVMLYDRLNQAITLNGLASTDNSNKFVLVPRIVITSVTPTVEAPINYVAEMEIMLSIVDTNKKLIMAQEMITKKGVGASEAKAIQEAIKSIKARDPKFKKMITIAKTKIIAYYNEECDKVVKTINTYIEMGEFDKALNELNAIPQIEDAELDCYSNSLDILSKISAEQQAESNDNIKNDMPDVSWVNE